MGTLIVEPGADQLIRQLMDDRIKAIENKDPERASSAYASNVVIFDLIGPLQQQGAEKVKQRLREWFGTFEGPINYEITDLTVEVNDGLAFCHSFNRIDALTTAGNKLDMYWRETLCLKEIGHRWLIIHAHSSVPFDGHSGKASMDLKPSNGA